MVKNIFKKIETLATKKMTEFSWLQTKFDWINLKLRHLDMRNKKAAASGVLAAIIIRKLLKARK